MRLARQGLGLNLAQRRQGAEIVLPIERADMLDETVLLLGDIGLELVRNLRGRSEQDEIVPRPFLEAEPCAVLGREPRQLVRSGFGWDWCAVMPRQNRRGDIILRVAALGVADEQARLLRLV